ncbi:MAG: type II toxin-antitoxin system HicB family antitoxin [bacterium]
MKFPVTLQRCEDGYIVVECPVVPGCVSQGRTEEEALGLQFGVRVRCKYIKDLL